MKKKPNIQKKKTPLKAFLDKLFKILVGVAIIIFIFIAYDNVDFSTNSFSLSSKKKTPPVAHTPNQLKWFDEFKGIENVKDKNSEKKSNSSSGFKYEGFNK